MILCICPNPSVDVFAWVDDIKSGQVNRIQREKRFPGGKGVHVALAIAELGEDVRLLGFWGGATGQWIRERCTESGVSCHGPVVEGWSRTCITFKSRGVYQETELLGCGPIIDSKDYEEFVNVYRQLLPDADVVCMSGSWPQGAAADSYAQLVRMANATHKVTLVDATGEQLQLALEERPTAVHMNRAEIQSFYGADDIRKNAIQLSHHCEYAAVTSGAEGLYLVHNGLIVHARCPVEKVYSAVGSGDCLLAGLATAFKRGASMPDAARLAVACGAANCIREDLGMLYRKDVGRLEPGVMLTTGEGNFS